MIEIIVELLKNQEHRRVLEIGCGKGNELAQLSRHEFRCYGIDFSEKALSLLGNRTLNEKLDLHLVRADARKLPLKSEAFDLAYSQGVLEHFQDPSSLLTEQYRVLQSGGYIVVEVPNKWTLYTVYKKILMAVDRWAPGWETEYSPKELKNLLEKNGFQVIDIVGWDFFLLKVFRKARRFFGFRDTLENSLQRWIRQHLQRNPFLLNFFASITLVAVKNS